MNSELTDEERNEMFSIANKAVKIMRANHICERFDFIFEEKKDRHFDYALLNCKSDENFRRIKSVTEVVKNGYVG